MAGFTQIIKLLLIAFSAFQTTFTYLSSLGHIEIPNFTFTTASIITREGDIAVQSTNSIAVTSYQLDPYICLSASSILTSTNSPLTLSTFQGYYTALNPTCKPGIHFFYQIITVVLTELNSLNSLF